MIFELIIIETMIWSCNAWWCNHPLLSGELHHSTETWGGPGLLGNIEV